MDVTQMVYLTVGGIIAYTISSYFITYLVTGTTTGDVLVQNIVPVVLAAGICIAILRNSLKS